MTRIEVVIVEQAPSVRTVLSRIVSSSEDLILVGEASDANEGGRLITGLRPNLLILGAGGGSSGDLPEMLQLAERTSLPAILLVGPLDTVTAKKFGHRIRAIQKPAIPNGWERLFQQIPLLSRELVRPGVTGCLSESRAERPSAPRFLALGASAGGPAAICRVLTNSGRSLDDVGVVVVQHIGAGFEEGFVDWLARDLPTSDVGLAVDGEELTAGKVRIGPPGAHLEVGRDGRVHLDRDSAPVAGHRPSVGRLFLSLAANHAETSVGILLSGMGEDGVEGLAAMRAAGSRTVVQEPSTCAIDGMPKAALNAGAAEFAMSPEEIGHFLLKIIRGDGE